MDTFRTPAEVHRATPAIEETNGNGSRVPGGSCRFLSRSARLLAFLLLFSRVACGAGLVEDFSYSDGPLTTASGGAWQKFDNIFVTDATVSGGEAVVGTDADVLRQFPAVLDAAGTTATFSFSVNIGSGVYDDAGYVVSLQPAAPPFNSATINYASSFGVGFLGTAPFLQSSAAADIFVIEGGQQVAMPIGDLSTDAWHTFSISLARTSTAPNTNYSLSLDGSLLRTGVFHISDRRALNSVEMNFATNGIPPISGYAHFDDIQIVPIPEPTAIGDLNTDGAVDAADYVVWRNGLGTIYNQNDYGVWRSHFGASLGPGSGSALPSAESLSAAVPEPAFKQLMLIAGVLATCSRRRLAAIPNTHSSVKRAG